MSLGNLSAFVDNFQQGAAGLDDHWDRMRKLKAMGALGTMLGQSDPSAGGGQPPQQQPQAGPPQQPQPNNPLAGLAALASAHGGGGAPQAGPQGPMPAQPPAAPISKYPDPNLSAVAQPPAGPGAAGPAGPPGMMGPQSDYSPPSAVDEAHQNIRSISASIKAANPGIDPVTLAMATEQQIENIKGVAPLTKATMQAQISTIRLQQDFQYKQARLQQAQQDLSIKLERAHTEEEKADALAEYHKEMVALGYERVSAGERNSDKSLEGREYGADKSLEGREYGANKSYDGKVYGADSSSDASGYRADQGYRGGQVRGGGAVDAAPARPQRPQRSSAPTATGKNGEKMEFRNGKWVPAK